MALSLGGNQLSGSIPTLPQGTLLASLNLSINTFTGVALHSPLALDAARPRAQAWGMGPCVLRPTVWRDLSQA